MASSTEFVGAILAGGRGTRMFPFTDRLPKPLLPLGNKPLIVHQIEMMKAIGIVDVVIVIGHKGYEISMALGDGGKFGVRIKYVEQTEILGIAHAVGRLEGFIDRPFLLFLGDIFFVPGNLENMLCMYRAQGQGAILAVKEEADQAAIRKNYSVVLGEDQRVVRVIEKPRHTTNRLKGVGVYLFDLAVFDAVRRTPRTAMRDEYEITDSIQVLIDDGLPVRVSTSIITDINITGPSDLLECNLLQLKSHSVKSLIGDNVDIHPDAVVEHSVVGSNVRISHPIKVRNSLVFENTWIKGTSDFDGFVVAPDAVVNCRSDHCVSHRTT